LSKAQLRRQYKRQRQDWPIHFPGKKPRIYLDADFPSGLLDDIRGRGIDAIHPEEVGTHNREDSFHWNEARRLKRILVTCNKKHFWSDQDYPLKDSAGVVVLDSGGTQDWEHVSTLLFAFIPYLRGFVKGPIGSELMVQTKIRLTADKMTWKYVTPDSRVETRDQPW